MRPVRNGFTLIELMIAVVIFSIMALLAYGGLDQIINARIKSADSLERLSDVQFAMRQLALDLGQLHPRPVREELGENLVPSVIADLRRFHQLELTRGGWRNPLGTPRPSLQRVAYRLEDGELIRSHWPVLDRLQSVEPVEFTLLEGLSAFEVRFLGENGDWEDEWPDPDLPADFRLAQRPRAIEVLMEFEDESLGTLRRIIEVLR